MKVPFPVLVLLLLAEVLTPGIADATAHLFVQVEDGIWLASDTFVPDRMGPDCKVVVTRGRLIYLYGSFSSASSLKSDFANLPQSGGTDETESQIVALLRKHAGAPGTYGNRADHMINAVGLFQVVGSSFMIVRIALATDGSHSFIALPDRANMGIPFGDAMVVEDFQRALRAC